MRMHEIVSINRKYFEPIRKGQITLLVFKTKILKDVEKGDYIQASNGSYDVQFRVIDTYIKSFGEFTENEAKKAGFLSKDFLKDELMSLYDIKPLFDLKSLSSIDDELFFCIEITTKEQRSDSETRVSLYSKEYNKEFYNGKDDFNIWGE